MSKQNCLICGGTSVHLNLGVRICRGCASFYRRARSQKLRFVCQQNNYCNLEIVGQRRKCKACRYEKCEKLGIVEFAPASKQGRRSYRKQTVSTLSPRITNPCTSNDLFKNVVEASSSLLQIDSSKKPTNLTSHFFISSTIKQVRQDIQNSSMDLLNRIPCLKILQSATKVKLIKKASNKLENLWRAYATTVFNLEGNQVAISNKYYLTLDELNSFLAHSFDLKSTNILTESILALPWINTFRRFAHKFKQLNVRKEETAFLMQLALIQSAEQISAIEDLDIYQEQLIAEFTSTLMQKHCFYEGTLRISQLMLLNVNNYQTAVDFCHLKTVMKFCSSI